MTARVILADNSGSMYAPAAGDLLRIDVLQRCLDEVLPAAAATQVIAFNAIPFVLERGAPLPPPGGGTALHLAIERAADFRPELLVVLSDGEPNDAEAALAAARALHCKVVTIFCGDERDHAALAFMTALAWCSADGLGEATSADLKQPQQLTGELRRVLLGPSV